MEINLVARITLTLSLLFSANSLFSQQIGVGTPFNSINNGYYERYGVAWQMNWRGSFANFGVPGQPIPPFGNFDPSSGLQTGWRFGNGNFRGSIWLSAAQGSNTSFVGQTPYVTSMNGYPAGFYDQSLSPFVTGLVPVVGDYPVFGPMSPGITPPTNSTQSNPLDRVQVMRRLLDSQNRGRQSGADGPDPGEAMLPRRSESAPAAERPSPAAGNSSADRPAPSVAEAKRLYEIEKKAAEKELAALLERAEAAEKANKPQLAKVYYQMVLRRAQGDMKRTAERRLEEIRTAANSQKSKRDEAELPGKEF